MQRIKLNSRYPIDPSKLDPEDIDFPEIAFLIDEKHAISTDGAYISLIGVVPDLNEPGAYKMADDWDEYVSIGFDEKRTFAGLMEILETLKQMSAWKMLTEHHNHFWNTFYVNRPRDYEYTIEEEGDNPYPVNEESPARREWDY